MDQLEKEAILETLEQLDLLDHWDQVDLLVKEGNLVHREQQVALVQLDQ